MSKTEKKDVREEIFCVYRRIPRYTESHQFTWGEIQQYLQEKNITLQQDDTLEVGVEEPDYDEGDYHYFVKVYRWRAFTKEERQQMKEQLQKLKEENREKRYQEYLKLKKEFENEQ